MALVKCDQLAAAQGGGSAVAGLGGASNQISGVEEGPPSKRFSFTIPASGPGSVAGDVLEIGLQNVFDRIFGVTVLVPGGGLGAATTLSIGKIDPNNAANTDAVHYSAAKNAAVAGEIVADTNLTEQVGVAPTGAASDTGDKPNPSAPGGGFGNAPIIITLTIGGTPTAGVVLMGWINYNTPAAV